MLAALLVVAVGLWAWARHPGEPEPVTTAPVATAPVLPVSEPPAAPPSQPVAESKPVPEPVPAPVSEAAAPIHEAAAPAHEKSAPVATKSALRHVPSKRTQPPPRPTSPPPEEPHPVAEAPSPKLQEPEFQAPESREPATLRVVARPWAEVFVDGQSRGFTPRVREVRLSPGTHRLRFDNPLCEPREEVLEVSPGQVLSRDITLRVRKAEVSIVALEGSPVFVDGSQLGVAPLPGPVMLEHGKHVFSARVQGGGFLRREVNVEAGARTEVVLRSSP